MATFRDNDGREYSVAIDGYVLSRVRAHGKVSLAALFEQGRDAAAMDPAILLEICYYGCEHCARIRSGKISKEEFLRALTGRALTDAIRATAEAMAECFAAPDDAAKGSATEETDAPCGNNEAERAIRPLGAISR